MYYTLESDSQIYYENYPANNMKKWRKQFSVSPLASSILKRKQHADVRCLLLSVSCVRILKSRFGKLNPET